MTDDNLDFQLKRFKHLIGVPPSPSSSDFNIVPLAAPDYSSKLPDRYQALADSIGGEVLTTFCGTIVRSVKHYPFGSAFGQTELISIDTRLSIPHSAFTSDHQDRVLAIKDLLFIDTETTGLGGSGAVTFLVGVGRVTDLGFVVTQYFLPDFSDEQALLELLLEQLNEEVILVSYNGAAFDLPLLKDRMIINRVAREIPCSTHLDLLHPARRLFKRRLKDCSLTNIERELFGYFRVDDFPGFLMPSVYFKWLSEEDCSVMPSVLEHNRQDIVSLYLLLMQLKDVFETKGGNLDYDEDLYSLSRIYGRRKQIDTAVTVMERVELDSDNGDGEKQLYFANVLKRQGESERASLLWKKISASQTRQSYWANLELAKFYEHRQKDPDSALFYARQALAISTYSMQCKAQLEKRIIRLVAKSTANSSSV